MAIDLIRVEQAISEVREILQLDGAELVLAPTQGPDVELQLVLDNASCKECVMPRAYLERLTLSKVREALPEVDTVRIHDPREDSPAAEVAN